MLGTLGSLSICHSVSLWPLLKLLGEYVSRRMCIQIMAGRSMPIWKKDVVPLYNKREIALITNAFKLLLLDPSLRALSLTVMLKEDQ